MTTTTTKVHVDRPNLNGQIRVLVVADSPKAATFVLARAIAALAARGYSLVLEADDLQIDRGPCDADFRGQFMVDVTPKCSRVTVARALRAAELVVEA